MNKLSLNSTLAQKLIRQGKLKAEDFAHAPMPNKYFAVPTADSTGRAHPSKLQARVTDRLRFGSKTVIPEVSIPLSERKNDRIRIDCLVIDEMQSDGIHFIGHFVEAKGKDLPAGIQKRRRFTDKYGVEIEVIKK